MYRLDTWPMSSYLTPDLPKMHFNCKEWLSYATTGAALNISVVIQNVHSIIWLNLFFIDGDGISFSLFLAVS